MLFACQPRFEMLHKKRTIDFSRAYKIKLTIFGCSLRGEVQGGPD